MKFNVGDIVKDCKGQLYLITDIGHEDYHLIDINNNGYLHTLTGIGIFNTTKEESELFKILSL